MTSPTRGGTQIATSTCDTGKVTSTSVARPEDVGGVLRLDRDSWETFFYLISPWAGSINDNVRLARVYPAISEEK